MGGLHHQSQDNREATEESHSLSPELTRTITEISQLETVEFASCPFDDIEIWRALIGEQKKRTVRSGLDPQVAFTLCGPDSNLHDFDPADLGG